MTMHMGVIGATGNMGQALVEHLAAEGHHVLAHGRNRASQVIKMAHRFTTDIHEVLRGSDVVFLAVKPQIFRDLDLQCETRGLVVSVMAGISMAELRERLRTQRIIRTMPNLAMTVGAGITAWMADDSVSEEERETVVRILERAGTTVELRDEAMFHTFTALTGSGPGLLAQVCAWFADAATEHGLGAQEAEQLAWGVVQGMARLRQEKGLTFDELRNRVTSPNGTTHHGLEALRAAGTKEALQAGFDAAKARSEVLGK